MRDTSCIPHHGRNHLLQLLTSAMNLSWCKRGRTLLPFWCWCNHFCSFYQGMNKFPVSKATEKKHCGNVITHPCHWLYFREHRSWQERQGSTLPMQTGCFCLSIQDGSLDTLLLLLELSMFCIKKGIYKVQFPRYALRILLLFCHCWTFQSQPYSGCSYESTSLDQQMFYQQQPATISCWFSPTTILRKQNNCPRPEHYLSL